MIRILYLVKSPEDFLFSGIFRKYKMVGLARYGSIPAKSKSRTTKTMDMSSAKS